MRCRNRLRRGRRADVEVFRALAVVAEPPVAETQGLLEVLGIDGRVSASDYADLFSFQLYPYASVYLGAEGMLGGEARDRIAGFWRALGEAPPAEPDHLAALLGLYARLAELADQAEEPKERAGWERARRALLWEHIGSWVGVFLAKLSEVADGPYRAWGSVLGACVAEECRRYPEPATLPLHLRDAPPFAPAEESGALTAELLAPVRTGFVLTRTDLARAARDVGLGLRAGERRYVLTSFLEQDPRGILEWLAAEAQRAGKQQRDHQHHAGVARFWSSRAEGTASFLRALTLEGAPNG